MKPQITSIKVDTNQKQLEDLKMNQNTRSSNGSVDRSSKTTPEKHSPLVKNILGQKTVLVPEISKVRKKKKILGLKDIRKTRYGYNEFVARPSLLDQIYQDSSISQSPFKGVMRCSLFIAFIYVVNAIAYRLQIKAEFILDKWFNMIVDNISIGIAFWILVYLWTNIAFVMHKLILKGLPFKLAQTIEFIFEQILFCYFPYRIFYMKVLMSTKAFMYFQIIIHYFKMNSYFKMNRDYRENYLKELQEAKEIEKEGIKKKFEFSSQYPNNVNLKDFIAYMLHPTLVYQDHYPVNEQRSLKTIGIRAIILVFSFLFIYEIYQFQLLPLAHALQDGVPTIEVFSAFYIPFLMLYFGCFFVIFEFASNLYADMSGFADRQFYQDFWNSTNFDEYARKWNKLVHEYLYRHIYLEYLLRWKFTVFQANVWTFIFSIIFHEIYLTLLFKQASFYLTSLQLNQIFLVHLFQVLRLKGTAQGNMIFWFGQFFGITSVLFIYTYDFCNYWYQPGGTEF
eukprot:403371796